MKQCNIIIDSLFRSIHSLVLWRCSLEFFNVSSWGSAREATFCLPSTPIYIKRQKMKDSATSKLNPHFQNVLNVHLYDLQLKIQIWSFASFHNNRCYFDSTYKSYLSARLKQIEQENTCEIWAFNMHNYQPELQLPEPNSDPDTIQASESSELCFDFTS